MLGGEFSVAPVAGSQYEPAIAADPDGGFAVAWVDQEEEGSPALVYFRRFDASGAPLSGELSVAPAPSVGGQFEPAIAADGSGGVDVAWAGKGLHARRFDAAGVALSGVIEVGPNFQSGFHPRISADPGGGFSVVWKGTEPGSRRGVFLRRFDAGGTPFEPALRIDPDTTTKQQQPVIAADGSGGAWVAWVRSGDNGEDETFNQDVFARHFASPLETQIDSGPAGPTNDSAPAFSFSSNEPGSDFECQFDGAGFSPCASPYSAGPHRFEVRATDRAGNRDQAPPARSFTVDTTPPRHLDRLRPYRPDQRDHPELRLFRQREGRHVRVPDRRRRLRALRLAVHQPAATRGRPQLRGAGHR